MVVYEDPYNYIRYVRAQILSVKDTERTCTVYDHNGYWNCQCCVNNYFKVKQKLYISSRYSRMEQSDLMEKCNPLYPYLRACMCHKSSCYITHATQGLPVL
jgi:hypothetical protein